MEVLDREKVFEAINWAQDNGWVIVPGMWGQINPQDPEDNPECCAATALAMYDGVCPEINYEESPQYTQGEVLSHRITDWLYNNYPFGIVRAFIYGFDAEDKPDQVVELPEEAEAYDLGWEIREYLGIEYNPNA